ncbi:telomere stability silencing protein [Cystoisospora suis]|uniref:Telomere stability silencing protein n=1 Tax=Cystoisospora suis TaxID=483139 RepID=A0A2C6KNT8_9APIC|nr:telomere stability silencing protein [Cystoisospora suis]
MAERSSVLVLTTSPHPSSRFTCLADEKSIEDIGREVKQSPLIRKEGQQRHDWLQCSSSSFMPHASSHRPLTCHSSLLSSSEREREEDEKGNPLLSLLPTDVMPFLRILHIRPSSLLLRIPSPSSSSLSTDHSGSLVLSLCKVPVLCIPRGERERDVARELFSFFSSSLVGRDSRSILNDASASAPPPFFSSSLVSSAYSSSSSYSLCRMSGEEKGTGDEGIEEWGVETEKGKDVCVDGTDVSIGFYIPAIFFFTVIAYKLQLPSSIRFRLVFGSNQEIQPFTLLPLSAFLLQSSSATSTSWKSGLNRTQQIPGVHTPESGVRRGRSTPSTSLHTPCLFSNRSLFSSDLSSSLSSHSTSLSSCHTLTSFFSCSLDKQHPVSPLSQSSSSSLSSSSSTSSWSSFSLSFPSFEILFLLLGGKGGFGALLKKQRKKQSRASINFDMSRDLSGRRLLHANTVERIKVWLKKKQEEQKAIELLSAQTEGLHIHQEEKKNDVSLDEKFVNHLKDNSLKIPLLLGEGLKNQQRHQQEAEKAVEERQRRLTVQQAKKKNILYFHHDILEEDEEEEEEEENDREDDESSTSTATSFPAQRPRSSSSSHRQGERDFLVQHSAEKKREKRKSKKEKEREEEVKMGDEEEGYQKKSTSSRFSWKMPGLSGRKNSLSSSSAVVCDREDADEDMKEREEEEKERRKKEEREESIRKEAESLDVGKFSSPEELEKAVDPEVMKRKLMLLGWKCGGRPSERASRLFVLKTLREGERPPASVLAKPAGGAGASSSLLRKK